MFIADDSQRLIAHDMIGTLQNLLINSGEVTLLATIKQSLENNGTMFAILVDAKR